jgi:hypothetical protein
MKAIRVLALGSVICLFFSAHAFGLATYDYLSDVNVTFSNLWDSYSTTITSTTYSTGQGYATTSPSQNLNLSSLSYYQLSSIEGSAGNTALNQGGTSHAYNSVGTTFAFDFATPTDLTITLADWNQIVTSSRQLDLWNPDNETGEYIGYWPTLGGGGTSLMLELDGQAFAIPGWTRGASTTFDDLTGKHTVLVWTTADETAIAGYPYDAPEPATLLFLASGLIGLIGLWRKFST